MRTLLFFSILLFASAAESGPFAKAVQSAAHRSHQRATKAVANAPTSIAATYAADRLRDSATPITKLERARTVHRYTNADAAKAAAESGFAPHTHFTSHAKPGRPLSPANAQRRFGLSAAPDTRITVRLPAGQNVRHNRVLAGEPGVGEITSTTPMPTNAVVRTVRLKPAEPGSRKPVLESKN
jgi:hypothetical protein